MSYELTLRFEQCGRQSVAAAQRINGLVRLKQVARLIEIVDLEANPRFSKKTAITADIIESLENTPEWFPVKSKGLLLAATEFNALDRDRYEIEFVDKAHEGVLDGGHNLLAIGLYMLSKVMVTDSEVRAFNKIKVWGEFRACWNSKTSEINDFLADADNESIANRQIPVELLLPKSDDELDRETFNSALIDIQVARNNNAELKEHTKTNQSGFYEELKKLLDPSISDRVEWKANQEGAEIKVSDIIALAWVPLSALELDLVDSANKKITPPSPVQTYSSKGECLTRFSALMDHEDVTTEHNGTRDLRNPKVMSAFKLAADMPKLYDLIYELFPDAYNAQGGRFGKIAAVSKMNIGNNKVTKFTKKKVDYKYPDGYIVPLVYSLRALIKVNEDGTVSWTTDPSQFIKLNIGELARTYDNIMNEKGFDPQAVGKSASVYDFCLSKVESLVLRATR